VLGALLRTPAQILYTPGELVAQALELPEAEQARPADSGSAGRRADVRKAVGDDRRHLPLEPCNLLAQRGAGRAVVELGCALEDTAECSFPVDRWLRGLAHAHSFTCAKRAGFYQRA
jgi:hypothetical protein